MYLSIVNFSGYEIKIVVVVVVVVTNLGGKNCKTKEALYCAFILTHFDYCNQAGKALLKSQEHQATRKGK